MSIARKFIRPETAKLQSDCTRRIDRECSGTELHEAMYTKNEGGLWRYDWRD
jgi:hypothetical protein